MKQGAGYGIKRKKSMMAKSKVKEYVELVSANIHNKRVKFYLWMRDDYSSPTSERDAENEKSQFVQRQ